eukprot:359710-Chlamydomonas_euryale.AAC.1
MSCSWRSPAWGGQEGGCLESEQECGQECGQACRTLMRCYVRTHKQTFTRQGAEILRIAEHLPPAQCGH